MKSINCDLGECLNPDPDQQVMPLIDQANIACGGHRGDQHSMVKTLTLAKRHRVKVGAHPSYPDKTHFGRLSMSLEPDVLLAELEQQLSSLSTLAEQQNTKVTYIKPHGALYHDMMKRVETAEVICQLSQNNGCLPIVIQAGMETAAIIEMAESKKIRLYREAFADRTYDGMTLRPRSEAGAMLPTSEAIVAQYQQLQEQAPFPLDTICFHSDHSASVEALHKIQQLSC